MKAREWINLAAADVQAVLVEVGPMQPEKLAATRAGKRIPPLQGVIQIDKEAHST